MTNAARTGTAALLTLICSTAALAGTDPWAPPAGHYDATTGTGATLKSQLYDRMRNPHLQRTYGEFRQSAALHDTDPNTPGNILLGYNRASVSATWDSGATWNREHVWPQSLQPGSASNGVRGNLGDPHSLKPLNPSINSSRGNKPFAFGDTIGSYRSLGTYYFVGEEDRGDIARSLFYSETRYGPELGLSLVNGVPGSNQMGDLESLIEWNYLDPPDTFERRRNHIIATQADNPLYFTNNRNAWIDHPEFVWSVYVDQANDSRLFVGPSADANGASTLMLSAGSVFTGDPAPAPTPFTLTRDGDDGTYFSITPLPGATSPQEFTANAFAINGPDTHAVSLGFDASATATSGFKAASAVIDNLDVTTAGGTGRGANDADDMVVIDLLVFDRAEASFSRTHRHRLHRDQPRHHRPRHRRRHHNDRDPQPRRRRRTHRRSRRRTHERHRRHQLTHHRSLHTKRHPRRHQHRLHRHARRHDHGCLHRRLHLLHL